MGTWDNLADKESLEITIANLKPNGISAEVVADEKAAKSKVLKLIPKGSSVMTMTSETLRLTGIADAVHESKNLHDVRKDLANKKLGKQQKNGLAGAPDFVLGSVHAVSQDGHLLIASQTGSQLGAYTYGAGKVIWVVGAQKVVRDVGEGIKRVYEYVLPLEVERAKKAYGTGSGVNKLLVFNKEVQGNRVHIIFINKKIGF